MYFRQELYIYISLLCILLLSACGNNIETHLIVDTITFFPQPIKVQLGKQAEANIEFQIKRNDGDCHVTDQGEVALELKNQDKESPVTWLANHQFLPNPVSFNGEVRKKKSCLAEASLNFRTREEAPLGLQRVKILLLVNALDLQKKQYVDFLIDVVP